MAEPSPQRSLVRNAVLAVVILAAGAGGGWLWGSHRIGGDPAARLGQADRAAIEQVVHDYLMAHPEVLPKAMAELERRENSHQLASVRGEVERAVPGAVLGNPQGKVVLVEFTDYACGYCRKSVADVDALIAANPDLKVVVRELPILTPESTDAARMALAAAEQGKYAAFHKAMFAGGRPSAETIAAAAAAAGLDLARARATIARPETEAELARNLALAKNLGFTGTPSWAIGDSLLSGAVGVDQLAKAIAEARR
ncbi:DsbA family protein [Novosphingobium bradum]|uniref:DsbA family protein n=1 Tax=Novosphingobium bradum TaxID=1737444 RepID=A0ABV7IQL3_9SPHN